MTYRTPLGDVALHPLGWLLLPSGAQISALPLIARGTSLWARLGPVSAEQWATSQGLRLPTTAELDELYAAAVHVEPVTLPTPDQLRAAGVSTSDQVAINRYRTKHMASLAWCEDHDAEVLERLAAVGWNNAPVANAGKHWTAGGGIYGWWRRGAPMIQRLSYAHKGSDHVDYATTTHVVQGGSMRTKLGDRGDAVKRWQEFLVGQGLDPGKPDGIHGRKTEAASVAYETRGTMPFVQARNYTVANRTAVDWIVLHSTENAIRPGVAMNVARWFAGSSAPRASAHYVIGPDVTVRCVEERNVAWAAPGANRQGVQLELVGQAAKTDWLLDGDGDTCGAPVMRRAAELVADLCRRWSIPVERLGPEDLRAGKRGIVTHASVGAAFKLSDHVDPGMSGDKRWPWESFLATVRSSRQG